MSSADEICVTGDHHLTDQYWIGNAVTQNSLSMAMNSYEKKQVPVEWNVDKKILAIFS